MPDTVALPPPTLSPTEVSEFGLSDSDPVCLDCGTPRLGAYCYDCGQHHPDDRLTLRSVWRDFAERFLKLERGLPATARMAVTDTGRLARNYVSGQRRRYVNPVSFLLIGSAIAVLLIPLYGSPERMMTQASSEGSMFGDADAQMDMGIRMAGGDPSDLSSEQRAEIKAETEAALGKFIPVYVSTVGQLYSVLSVVLALALAAFLKLFFSGRPRTYTFAETLVLGLFFAGAYSALSALVASGVALAGGSVNAGLVATTTLLVAGAAWSAAGFYGRTWGNAALGALSGILAFVVYTVGIMAIALPVVIIKMV